MYRALLLFIRVLLAVVFIISGLGKIIDSSDSVYLANQFIHGFAYVTVIIKLISVVELLIALLLLWGKKLGRVLTASLVMVLAFSGLLGYLYLQESNIENCGCFGAFGFSSGLEFTLLRNFVLIALIIFAYLLMKSGKKQVKLN